MVGRITNRTSCRIGRLQPLSMLQEHAWGLQWSYTLGDKPSEQQASQNRPIRLAAARSNMEVWLCELLFQLAAHIRMSCQKKG